MTYRVKQLVLDTQEAKVHGTFQTEGEAKMRFAQILDEAFDSLELDAATVRQKIEDALHDGYLHFREHGKVTRWYMIERD